jgi:hypothetical protein
MTSAENNLIIEVNYDELNDNYKTKFLHNIEEDASTGKPSEKQEFNLLNTEKNELAIYDDTVDKINIEWEKLTGHSTSTPDFQIKNINFLKKKSDNSPEYTAVSYAIKNYTSGTNSGTDIPKYNLKMVQSGADQSGGTAKKTRMKRKKTKIVKRSKTLRGKSRNNLRG